MAPVFEVDQLAKTYRTRWSRRAVCALDDITLSITPGVVFGLLGPNGAGKTTLIKIALTIARQDSGDVRIFGQSNHDRKILRRVGYLPENPRFPSHLTARQVLHLYGSLSGAPRDIVERNSGKWLERLDLVRVENTRVVKFSKGMNERLALAQALVHEPDLIFLDEPTDGLDPFGRMEVRAICRELAAAGKTIFINSHILAELEMICDQVALMRQGRIIETGSVAKITETRGYEVSAPASQRLASWLEEKLLAFRCVNDMCYVSIGDRASANALIDALRNEHFEIESLVVARRSLESAFLEKINDHGSAS